MSIPIALGIGHGTVGRSAEREIRVGWGCVGHYAGASARLCNFGAMRPGGSPTEAGTRSWPGWHRGSRGMRPKQEAPKSDQAGTLPSEWPEPYQSHMKRRGPSCGFVELGDIAPLRPSARLRPSPATPPTPASHRPLTAAEARPPPPLSPQCRGLMAPGRQRASAVCAAERQARPDSRGPDLRGL